MMWQNFPWMTSLENTFANHFIVGNLSCKKHKTIRKGMPPGWALPEQTLWAPYVHLLPPLPSLLSRSEQCQGRSHFVRAVAPVVHCCWHGHNQRRHAVPHQIEILPPGVLALKNLHQHDVELHPLQEHPGESCQEEEVQEGSKDGTGNLYEDWKEQGKVFVLWLINATVRSTLT